MNFIENIKMALGSISANKMRSLLTMLGIIIGISAVILITTLGTTLRSTVKKAFNSFGVNYFVIYPDIREYDENKSYYYDENAMITLEMLNGLLEEYPDEFAIANVTAPTSAKTVNSQNTDVNVNITGTFDGKLEFDKLKLLCGRNLTMRDNNEHKYTAIVSDIFVRQYFRNNEDPLGQSVEFTLDNGLPLEFTIVGVYKYSEINQQYFEPNTAEKNKITPVFVPYMIMNTVIQQGSDYVDSAHITWNTDFEYETVKKHIDSYFEKAYAENKDWTTYCYSGQEDMNIIDTLINVVTMVVSVIAAISLIVGGVGVMNIMLVSVTERTREIGIRKALGAKRGSIKMQFVTEAIILCLIGGIIGVILGLLGGKLVGVAANIIIRLNPEYSDVLGNITIVPSVEAIVISLVFSILTGVFFGLYPAGKASKMNPIDALRYD